MRQQAMYSRILYGRPMPVQRMVQVIADSQPPLNRSSESLADTTEAQANTQYYGKRPYGVGFLVIGEDVSTVPVSRTAAPAWSVRRV